MSLDTTFNRMRREIGIKRCIIIDGNVGDLYLNSKMKIKNIEEMIEEILLELKYDKNDIFHWDCISGLSGTVENLDIVEDAIVDEDEETVEDDYLGDRDGFNNNINVNKTAEDVTSMLNIVYKNMIKPNKKVAFILNWTNYMFGSTTQLGLNERRDLTLLNKAIKDKKLDYFCTRDDEGNINESVVILITNQLSMFPISFYQNNVDVSCITLPKPDRREREKLLEKIEDNLNIKLLGKEETLMVSEKKNEYIDLLDGFTNKEIIQMTRFSNKETKMTFEKLYWLFKYGEKDNPWEKLDYKRIKEIENILAEKVIGQEEAIQKIKKLVIKAYMGITGIHKNSSRSMPKGVLFFVGPTGVGKTELSKALAKFLFGDEQACIRFDMSEYAQENSDQKLIGAPPGYVGFEEGGQLTNAVKEKPFSLILFDEIEKATGKNPRILDIFLQILEDGRLTDSKGETVSFSECVIIFTSNLGTSEVIFTPDRSNEEIAKDFINEVKKYFDQEIKRPELLGRIGKNNIVPFNFINNPEFSRKIALSKLDPIRNAIKEKFKFDLEFENELEFISYITKFADIQKGGRDILNTINDILLDQLAMYLFEQKEELRYQKNGKLSVSVNKSRQELNFEFI